jgi:PTH1 family peptidyl-tRNA hydrolase
MTPSEIIMLIIGLGNPDSEYTDTRHNAGFMALDAIAGKLGLTFQDNSKFEGQIASTQFEGQKIFLLKPNTFMNLSGRSVSKIKNYYKIELSDIVVIHDEIDIDCGKIKHKIGGGSAGHNGIKSIDSNIGKDYHRIRIGIGRPEHKDEVSDYVLKNFAKSERVIIEESITEITQNIKLIIQANWDEFKKKT